MSGRNCVGMSRRSRWLAGFFRTENQNQKDRCEMTTTTMQKLNSPRMLKKLEK